MHSFLISWGGVRLSTLATSANIWHIVPAQMNDECGQIGGMISQGKPK
jgi:hypothetical protein